MSYKVGDKILVELTVGAVQTRSDGEKEYFIATSDTETDMGMWIDETELSHIEKGGVIMKYTINEVINAINVIRETCKECKNCEGCPFLMDNGDCGMRPDEDPFQWQFEFDKDEGIPLDKWQL